MIGNWWDLRILSPVSFPDFFPVTLSYVQILANVVKVCLNWSRTPTPLDCPCDMASFSDRFNHQPADAEITIREDAPSEMRYAVLQLATDNGLRPSALREIACSILFVRPDRGNWSDYPNIWDEVERILEDAPWFRVYDIAEAIYQQVPYDKRQNYADGLNRYFRQAGIGWQMTPDGIVYRGDQTYAAAVQNAAQTLLETCRQNAANEIREAIRDISRRPKPDTTGAIQHSVAAMECVARDVLGERRDTLGVLLPRLGLPRPLDQAVEKLWGFSSERARHIREGETVDDDQAELVVSVACAVCAFLAKRARN
jgi:hypothetical protein